MFHAFAMATPGMRELLCMGKIWELAQLERRAREGAPYDFVVVDAPATGHGVGFLQTPRTFAEIARVGPIASQASRISATIADRSFTGLVAVSTPEEMPVTETLALGEELARQNLAIDAVILNARYQSRFSDEDLPTLEAALRAPAAPGSAPRYARRSPSTPAAGTGRAAGAPRGGLRHDRLDAPVRVLAATIGVLAESRRGTRDSPPRRDGIAGMNAAELLAGKRICICAGSGGVGKTTRLGGDRTRYGGAGRAGGSGNDRSGQAPGQARWGSSELENEPRLVAPDRLATLGPRNQG